MESRSTRLVAMVGLLALLAAAPTRAGYVLPAFFVDDPTKNARNWTAAVAAAGGVIDTSVNFQSMGTGTLNGMYYDVGADNPGVRLYASDSSLQVATGPGPGQMGQLGPVSTGEGESSYSQYLQWQSPGPGGHSSLTISFVTPVLAAGLF